MAIQSIQYEYVRIVPPIVALNEEIQRDMKNLNYVDGPIEWFNSRARICGKIRKAEKLMRAKDE